MSTAKLIDEYPPPKQAEKQAQQVQAQARQERRRSDAAATVAEKDTQNAPEQPANSEAPAMTSVSAPQPWPDNPSAAAPMKQRAQGKAATNATGRRDAPGRAAAGGRAGHAPTEASRRIWLAPATESKSTASSQEKRPRAQ